MSRPGDNLVTSVSASLEAIAHAWRELDDASTSNVFLTYEWVDSWWRVYGEGHEPYLIVVRDRDGSTVGIAPLVRSVSRAWGIARVTSLRFMGHNVSDRLGFVSRQGLERQVAAAVTQHLDRHRGDWSVLELVNLVEGSAELDVLSRWFAHRDVLLREPGQACPFLPLEGRWDTYLQSLAKKFRTDLRRGRRRFTEELDGRMLTCANPSEVRAALTFLFHHNTGRFSGGQHTVSAFSDLRIQEFNLTVAPRLLERGRLVCHRLDVDGATVAVKYNFRHGGTTWSYNAAFDARWSAYGLGKVLLTYAIEHAYEAGDREYDFLLGDEAYKQRWTPHARVHWHLGVVQREPMAIARVALPAWLRALKRWGRRAAPPSLVRVWDRARQKHGHRA